MQILEIRFKNINSLKGEHTIDFRKDPLSAAGLFAITGPTGSGKSTVLDVITLALFCRIPRVSEAITRGFIEKSGLIVTRNTPDAMAEVTYSCNRGTFTSQWSISTNRNGKLRDYEMQISDAATNVLTVARAHVPSHNESLIGLNFEQFVKAIILAQGDFAAFLKAKKDERGKLLEKITGTWIYRVLGRKAYEKSKDFGQVLEGLQAQEKSRREQLITDDDYTALLADIAQSDQQILECRELIEKLKVQEKLKEDIAGLGITIQNQEARLLTAWEKLKAFHNEHGEGMEKHANLQPYRKNLSDWKAQANDLKKQEQRLREIDQEFQDCTMEDTAIREEVTNLTRSDAPVKEALDTFQKQVLNIQRRLSEAESLKQSMGSTVMAEAEEISIAIDKTDPGKAKEQLQKIRELNTAEIERLKNLLSDDSLIEPEKKLEELKAATDILQLLIAETRIWQNHSQQLTRKNDDIKVLKEETELIPSQLKDVVARQKLSELELRGYQKDKSIRDLTLSLDEHRKKLVAGEECPLCGSTVHPFSEGLPVIPDDLVQKIDLAAKANDALIKTVNTLESTLLINQKSLEKGQREIAELVETVKKSGEKADQLRDSLPEAYKLDEMGSTLTWAKQESENIISWKALSEKSRRLNALGGKVSQWENYFLAAATLSEELESIFTGPDVLAVTKEFYDRLTANSTRQNRLQHEKETLAEKTRLEQNDFQALSDQLAAELPGYDSPATALADLMDDGEYARLQTSGNQLNQEIAGLESGLKVHQGNLVNLKENDVETSLDEIKEIQSGKEKESQELNNRRDDLKGKQKFQENTLKELTDLQSEIAIQKEQNEKWVLLNKYIGDAEGKRFSTFAQELTLLQLIHKANKKLTMLNDRYLLAIPDEGEDDSLVVIDTHMGDMRRSVKSLSGGETFLVSLALALALSDLAAHKVEIKSLFIDEGFGSLDKLTLDQTMDTLEKLQYETGKTIGVISHVEAMQERITTQIKLEKGGQGHSRLLVL